MTAARYDFEVRAGNTGRVKNKLGLVIERPTDGKTFHFLTTDTGSGVITKEIGSGIAIGPPGTLTVSFTSAETRQITAAGVPVRYEIEERDAVLGYEDTFIYGDITGLWGTNTDD